MKLYDETQNRPDSGAQFPDADGFFYSGPSPDVWAGYLKNQLRHTLAPLPQERDGRLAALRKAQQSPDWQWNASRQEHLEDDQYLSSRVALGVGWRLGWGQFVISN